VNVNREIRVVAYDSCTDLDSVNNVRISWY